MHGSVLDEIDDKAAARVVTTEKNGTPKHWRRLTEHGYSSTMLCLWNIAWWADILLLHGNML